VFRAKELDAFTDLIAETGKLSLGKQIIGTNDAELKNSGRPAKIVEGIGHLSVSLLEHFENGKIPLMKGFGFVRGNACDLAQGALTEPFKCNQAQLSEYFPVRFSNVARHDV
jgi:hypothetical protein